MANRGNQSERSRRSTSCTAAAASARAVSSAASALCSFDVRRKFACFVNNLERAQIRLDELAADEIAGHVHGASSIGVVAGTALGGAAQSEGVTTAHDDAPATCIEGDAGSSGVP